MPPIKSETNRYLYLYTCEQSQRGDGSLTHTIVLLDDSTTVIDGGNIITGTVTANAIKADSGTFNTANIPNLDAAKITSGDIVADRIKTNVVSAINATANKIDAKNINVSSINIGDLTGEIGGRNLLRRTANPSIGDMSNGYWVKWSANDTVEKTSDGIKITSSGGAPTSFRIPLAYEGAISIGETITVSFDYRGNMTGTGAFYFMANPSPNVSTTMNALVESTTEWVHFEQTFNFSGSPGGPAVQFMFPYKNASGKWLEIKDSSLKLERGNTATDWTPAPEDTDSAIDDASKIASNYIHADSSGIRIASANPATQKQRIWLTSGRIDFYNADDTSIGAISGDVARFGKLNHTYVNINGNDGDIDIYKNGYLKAKYSSTITLYGGSSASGANPKVELSSTAFNMYDSNGKVRSVINASGLDIKDTDGSTSVALFAASSRIGKAASGHVIVDSTGMTVYDTNNKKRTAVNASGLTVYDASEVDVGNFAATARIGKSNSSRFLMNATSLQAYDSSNKMYFEVSSSGLKYGTDLSASGTTNVVASQAYVTGQGYQTSSDVQTAITNADANKRDWYATCPTAAATAAKVATIDPVTTKFSLVAGQTVKVLFSDTNSATPADLTLNVNSKGAKNIKYIYNGGYSNIPAANYLKANQIYTFTYDGTYWIITLGYNTNSNTYDRTLHNNYIKATAAITSGKIICGTSSGYKNLAASTAFDISYPLLYASEAVAANGQTAKAYERMPGVNIATTLAVADIPGIAANKVVFIKGTISGTTFTTASANFLTCTPPSSAVANEYYIPIGILANDYSSSETNKLFFETSKELWCYNDEAFGPTSIRNASAAAKTASNYISYDSTNGLKIASSSPSSSTRFVQVKSDQVRIQNDGSNYAYVDTNGLTIYKGGDNVANFGTTTRIGKLDSNYISIDSTSGISLFYSEHSTGASGTTAITSCHIKETSIDLGYSHPVSAYGFSVEEQYKGTYATNNHFGSLAKCEIVPYQGTVYQEITGNGGFTLETIKETNSSNSAYIHLAGDVDSYNPNTGTIMMGAYADTGETLPKKTTITMTGLGISLSSPSKIFALNENGATITGRLSLGYPDQQSVAPTGRIAIQDSRSYAWTPTSLDKGINWYFTKSNGPDTSKWWAIQHVKGWTGDYNAWELAGTATDSDERTSPLYVRTGRTTNGWGSWRKIYDTSNKPTTADMATLISKFGSNTTASFNTTGSNGTITLTETAANFTIIDIFFKGNNGYYDFTRVYNPNGKTVNLATMESTTGSIKCKWKAVAISGTSISTKVNSSNNCYAEMDGNGTPANVNRIYICGVVGYK